MEKKDAKRKQGNFGAAAGLLILFIIWTIVVSRFDVQAIGPEKSLVGFAKLNGFFHRLTGEHLLLYMITDWLEAVPFCFVLYFAVLGARQAIKEKSLRKVDRDILMLGGFYILVGAAYALFETVIINYRPVLIEGVLEPSYPSSTTLLVLCVMPTAMLQLGGRIRNEKLKRVIDCAIILYIIIMVVGRLVSGVHWLTDIIGSILLSAGLVMLYAAACNSEIKKRKS
jgi:membrane-associated phospholipid phosphatase